jgi:hypothetical protein
LSLALAACATKTIERQAAPSRPLRSVGLEEVLASYERYCDGLQTFSASGDLDVKDLRAGKQRKLGVRLVAARGDRLYLKGQVLVVTAIEVVSNGDRFWFQVPSKKTVWTGLASSEAPPAEGSDQAPYYALRPRDITAALLPEALQPGAEHHLALETEGDLVWLTLARSAGGRGIVRRRVGLERSTLRPVRLRHHDERGELDSEAALQGWRDGAPRRVVVSRPGEGYVADFNLDKVVINRPVPERAFEPRPAPGFATVEVGR